MRDLKEEVVGLDASGRTLRGGGVKARAYFTGADAFSRQLLEKSTLEVTEFPFRIGRENRRLGKKRENRFRQNTPNNDLYIRDSSPHFVAREHMQIEHTDCGYYVRDRGSLTGTTVNGRLIGGGGLETKASLNPGDNQIVLGENDSPFRFIIRID